MIQTKPVIKLLVSTMWQSLILSSMWQTVIPINPSDESLTLGQQVFSTGSCFADAIGHRLASLRLPILNNPLGILYNPHSLSQQFAYFSGRKIWNGDESFEHQSLWRHFDFHSQVSLSDKSAYIDQISSLINQSTQFLRGTSCVILTLGTSFVWETGANQIVGNCHKLPGSTFSRRLLSTSEIHRALEMIAEDVRTLRPDARILFTVSPIRHLRDGLVQSSRSKARLIDACHSLAETHGFITYFPAFELMVDELRDYRFYAADMLHPSDTATDYIFRRFFESHFYKIPDEYIRLVTKLNKLEGHRPQNQSTQADQVATKIQSLQNQLTTEFGLTFEPHK